MNGRKRPCVILVADSNMAAVFRGYFGRDQWHRSLGCAPFEFDAETGQDLLVDEGGNDPGVYSRAHELLRPYQRSHERALVVLDCEWGGSPGQSKIVADITANLVASGWRENAVKVIAIEPELENWLWQDNPCVKLQCCATGTSRRCVTVLEQQGCGLEGQGKPPRPKEAAGRGTAANAPAALLRNLGEVRRRISIKGCSDAAFLELHATLQAWFPPETPT